MKLDTEKVRTIKNMAVILGKTERWTEELHIRLEAGKITPKDAGFKAIRIDGKKFCLII